MHLTDIEALTSGFPGTTGIIIRTVDGDQGIQLNHERLFPAASLIKLPILWEFFVQCAKRKINPDERIELSANAMTIGSGVLRQLNPGLNLSLYDLATLMVIVSDNTATNLLIDKLGFDAINRSIQQLGLVSTTLRYKMFDPHDIEKDNLTSPADIALMLETFRQRKQVLGRYRDEPLKILEGQQCKHKFHQGIPKGTRLANKTGEMTGIEHDAGILFVKSLEVIIVVMTKDLQQNYDGVRLCRQISRLVYEQALRECAWEKSKDDAKN